MAGRVVEVETGEQFEEGAWEGGPVEVEAEVVGEVDAWFGGGGGLVGKYTGNVRGGGWEGKRKEKREERRGDMVWWVILVERKEEGKRKKGGQTKVTARGHRVKGMLELELVHVDGDVGAVKVLEAAPVVEMQVAHHHGLDVLDAMARLGDGLVQIVLLGDVVDLREDVVRDGLYNDITRLMACQ